MSTSSNVSSIGLGNRPPPPSRVLQWSLMLILFSLFRIVDCPWLVLLTRAKLRCICLQRRNSSSNRGFLRQASHKLPAIRPHSPLIVSSSKHLAPLAVDLSMHAMIMTGSSSLALRPPPWPPPTASAPSSIAPSSRAVCMTIVTSFCG